MQLPELEAIKIDDMSTLKQPGSSTSTAVYNTTKLKLRRVSDLPKVSQLVSSRAQARSQIS